MTDEQAKECGIEDLKPLMTEEAEELGIALPDYNSDINFQNVEFKKDVSFSGFIFPQTANFIEAAFSGEADFSEAAFSGVAYFSEAAFSGVADFSKAAFSKEANFIEAVFSGRVHFIEAAFSEGAYFIEAAFSEWADFSEAAFSGEANFIEAAFSGVADFSKAAFSEVAYFYKAVFKSNAVFKNAIYKSVTNYKDVLFEVPPEFEQSNIHQDTTFRGARFPIQNPKREEGFYDRAESAFRCLKGKMIETHNHDGELKFFGLELDVKLRTEPGYIRAGIFLYKITSNYGQNALLPILYLCLITVTFPLLYTALFNLSRPDALSYSLANTFSFTANSKVAIGRVYEYIEKISPDLLFSLQALGALQTLLGIIFIFLFGLALKNLFSIK